MIDNLTIGDLMIDCADAGRAREFYARLTGWQRTTVFECPALLAGNGMTVLFAEPDLPHEPPIWPEEPGRQQKQMHLDFQVDDLAAAVTQAIRLGATVAAEQYGGEHFVTLIDTEGHPFCLCRK